jgi:hypothetical protein
MKIPAIFVAVGVRFSHRPPTRSSMRISRKVRSSVERVPRSLSRRRHRPGRVSV